MKLINRGVVVIKPRQPFLDWINRDSTSSSPVSMELLEQDRTAILVPELDSIQAVLDYVEALKPMLFEMELESWNGDPATWPQDRTPELFDAWLELEVHSMVWDAVGGPVVKEDDEMGATLTGTWDVVSSPDFDDDYLHMDTAPYVTLHADDAGVNGKFHVGLIAGSLLGFLEGDRVLFSFEGMDEMDPVNGAGTITLQGERLIFQLLFHYGDLFTFECVPQRQVEE